MKGELKVEVTDRFIETVLDDRGIWCRVITCYEDGSRVAEELDYWEVLETLKKERFNGGDSN